MRHADYYNRTMQKRHWLAAHGELSEPDVPGANVAILVPFMPVLVRDRRDTEKQFELQTERVQKMYRALGRETTVFMRATVDDFKTVFEDKQYTSVVTAGFGNVSAIAVPLERDKRSPRYCYINWLRLAEIGTHLKVGKFVMAQCGGFNGEFNPPLGVGVVTSHRNIIGQLGQFRYASDEIPTTPVTDVDELSYSQIRREFRVERFPTRTEDEITDWPRRVAHALSKRHLIPDTVWVKGRDVYNAYLNRDVPDQPLPEPEKTPIPDVKGFPRLERH